MAPLVPMPFDPTAFFAGFSGSPALGFGQAPASLLPYMEALELARGDGYPSPDIDVTSIGSTVTEFELDLKSGAMVTTTTTKIMVPEEEKGPDGETVWDELEVTEVDVDIPFEMELDALSGLFGAPAPADMMADPIVSINTAQLGDMEELSATLDIMGQLAENRIPSAQLVAMGLGPVQPGIDAQVWKNMAITDNDNVAESVGKTNETGTKDTEIKHPAITAFIFEIFILMIIYSFVYSIRSSWAARRERVARVRAAKIRSASDGEMAEEAKGLLEDEEYGEGDDRGDMRGEKMM